MQKVIRRLLPSYSWHGMKGNVQIHLSTCPICDKYPNPRKRYRAALKPIPTSAPGAILAIEMLGGMTSLQTSEAGNKYILTKVDLFTRFGVAAPMTDQTAKTVVDTVLARWILLLGERRRILSGQSANFESSHVENLCALWRIEKVRTTAYLPTGNGACDGSIKPSSADCNVCYIANIWSNGTFP